MKRDIVFWSSKRFKFENIDGNDFRVDGRENGWSQRLKISNLNLIYIRV